MYDWKLTTLTCLIWPKLFNLSMNPLSFTKATLCLLNLCNFQVLLVNFNKVVVTYKIQLTETYMRSQCVQDTLLQIDEDTCVREQKGVFSYKDNTYCFPRSCICNIYCASRIMGRFLPWWHYQPVYYYTWKCPSYTFVHHKKGLCGA